jgi:hypothetical protein
MYEMALKLPKQKMIGYKRANFLTFRFLFTTFDKNLQIKKSYIKTSIFADCLEQAVQCHSYRMTWETTEGTNRVWTQQTTENFRVPRESKSINVSKWYPQTT